jgi:hypothetical protein
MFKQCPADALAFVAGRDRHVRDMAIGVAVEEVLGFLQMDETDRFAVGVLGHEQEAVGRLFFQMAREVAADAFDAFVPFAPGRQREVHEARSQAEDEIVIVLGQSYQQMRLAHDKLIGGCSAKVLPQPPAVGKRPRWRQFTGMHHAHLQRLSLRSATTVRCGNGW